MRKKKALLTSLTERNNLLHQQCEILQQHYSANAELFHDMSHHLQVIYHLAEKGENREIKDYILRINTPVRALSGCVWTGIDIVDAILNSKKQMTTQKGYMLDINVELPANTGIASDDFCSILSNLLDNALEAMERQHYSKPPEPIKLNLRRIHHFLLIQVSNSCVEIPKKKHGFFLTSKKDDTLHGWGLRSVEDAVRKYNGTFSCNLKEGVFTATAMLFYPEKKEI